MKREWERETVCCVVLGDVASSKTDEEIIPTSTPLVLFANLPSPTKGRSATTLKSNLIDQSIHLIHLINLVKGVIKGGRQLQVIDVHPFP
jgi:hypothetical protein